MTKFTEFSKRGKGGTRTYARFEVDGLADIARDLDRMEREARTDLGKKALRATMQPVAADVRGNVPVDHGSLKSSVRVTAHNDKKGVKAEVRAGVPGPHGSYKRSGATKPVYALQVEYGTGDTPEQPFMRPAFDGKEVRIANRAKRLLGNLVMGWKLRTKNFK